MKFTIPKKPVFQKQPPDRRFTPEERMQRAMQDHAVITRVAQAVQKPVFQKPVIQKPKPTFHRLTDSDRAKIMELLHITADAADSFLQTHIGPMFVCVELYDSNSRIVLNNTIDIGRTNAPATGKSLAPHRP